MSKERKKTENISVISLGQRHILVDRMRNEQVPRILQCKTRKLQTASMKVSDQVKDTQRLRFG